MNRFLPSLRGASATKSRPSSRPDGLLRLCSHDRELFRRQDRPLDFAEADAVTIALTPAVDDKRIAVLEKGPYHAAFQLDRFGAIPGDFKQAAALALLRPGNGAGAKQVADIHRTTGRSVMHQLLHR